MSSTGIDDTLSLDVVYFSAPIPRNLAVLTILGAVFDKVYFPGVHIPKDGYDIAELDKEIARLEALPESAGFDTALLIGILKLTKQAKALEGFCVFTADPGDPFGQKTPVPPALLKAVIDAVYGPPRPGFIPSFHSNHCKGLPGGEESVIYPGDLHYLAKAIINRAVEASHFLMISPACRYPASGT